MTQQKTLEQLEELSQERYVTPYGIARIHVTLGNKNEALHSPEIAYEKRAEHLLDGLPLFVHVGMHAALLCGISDESWCSVVAQMNELKKLARRDLPAFTTREEPLEWLLTGRRQMTLSGSRVIAIRVDGVLKTAGAFRIHGLIRRLRREWHRGLDKSHTGDNEEKSRVA
jgi:hypothetical protein